MLTLQSIREEAPGTTRRWYADEYFDLYLWEDAEGTVRSFQLCYDKTGRERAFTWTQERGAAHHAVDDGEGLPTENRAPVLTSDAVFPAELVRKEFVSRSAALEAGVREVVLEKIAGYAGATETPGG